MPAPKDENTFLYVALGVLGLTAFSVGIWVWHSKGEHAPNWKAHDSELTKLEEKLQTLADEIRSEHGSGACGSSDECRVLGLGAKVCGGYNDFLIYSVTDVEEQTLLATVREFNNTAEKLNNLSLKVPKCGAPPAPIDCVRKRCTPRL